MTTAMRRHPSFVAGCVLVGLWLAAVLLSLLWTPYPPTEIDVPNRLLLPSAAHWLGTDSLGRDIASLLIVGARTSLLVGVAAVGLGALLGTAIGVLGAARRGWLDALLMRVADFSFAFPALLTALMLAALAGPGVATAVVAIAVFNAAVFARISRSAAGAVWSRDFVLAARACGRSRWQITIDHVLPNIAAPLIVQATIQFAVAILAEAALSYLGLGVRPPQPSWGRMLNEAQEMMFQAPQLALYPGVAIALAVLGLNLVGDGLRDLLDPRLVRER
jgi:peptide/nickel transport system permease protein